MDHPIRKRNLEVPKPTQHLQISEGICKKQMINNNMNKNSETQEHPLHDYYSGIYRRYDIMNRLFTFRQDER